MEERRIKSGMTEMLLYYDIIIIKYSIIGDVAMYIII